MGKEKKLKKTRIKLISHLWEGVLSSKFQYQIKNPSVLSLALSTLVSRKEPTVLVVPYKPEQNLNSPSDMRSVELCPNPGPGGLAQVLMHQGGSAFLPLLCQLL